MNGQAPNQNGSTPGTPVTPGGKPSILLDDPIFSAIHDALQMGWSIIELKSRLQVAAMSTSISGSAQTSLAKRPADSTGGQVDKILQDVLSAVENAKSQLLLPESAILQQQPADSTASRQNMTDLPDNAWFTSLWRATFSRIAESHKRSFPGSSTANTYYDLPDPSTTPNYQALAASPQGYDASTTYLPYLYLFPAGGQDYGNIGIQRDIEIPSDFKLYDVARRALNCLTLLYANPEESLIPVTVSEFQNQLVQNISNYRQLTATLSNAAQPQSEPTTPNQPAASQGGEVGQPGTASGATPQDAFSSEEQRNNAIQLVSNQAVHYLETWDSYARETLYVSGGGDVEANEMQLIAYEAGRAMASLSWGITTATVPIEDAMNQRGEDIHAHPELKKRLEETWLSVFDERSITSIQRQVSALSTALDEAYYRVHPNVSRQDANDVGVQPNLDLPSQAIRTASESLNYWMRAVHLICTGDTQQQDGTSSNAPSTATDNTAQSRLTTPQPDAQNQEGVSSNRDTPAGSPSASASASTHTNSVTPTPTPTPTPRPAAIPAMTWETSSQLRLALIQQAEVWQSLLAGHQSLRDFTTSLVTQRIWNDFSQELEQAISKGLLNPVEQQIRRYAIPIAAVVGVLLVIIGVVVLLLVLLPSLRESLITAFVFIVGGVLGFFGTVASRVSSFFSPASNEQPAGATAAPGSAGAVPAIAGLAGAALIDAFQNGYKQILIEFDYLNHNVAVTYPLVEYFIAHSTQLAKSNGANNTQTISSAQANTNRRGRFFAPKSKESSNQSLASETAANVGFLIKDAYDFLVQIVWTSQERADEIGRIARAAFGPIGAFVGAQITPSSTQNSASSTSKRPASAPASRS